MSDNQQLLQELRDFLQRRRLAGDNSITAVELEDEDLVFTYERGHGAEPVLVRVSGMRAVLDVLERVTQAQATIPDFSSSEGQPASGLHSRPHPGASPGVGAEAGSRLQPGGCETPRARDNTGDAALP